MIVPLEVNSVLAQCDRCGRCSYLDDGNYMHDIDDETLCDSCAEKSYFYCDTCWHWFNREYHKEYELNGDILCEECYNKKTAK